MLLNGGAARTSLWLKTTLVYGLALLVAVVGLGLAALLPALAAPKAAEPVMYAVPAPPASLAVAAHRGGVQMR